MSEWISVKDGLPDNEDKYVLVAVSGKPRENITLYCSYEFGVYNNDDGWIIEAYPEWETPRVTHWMPLPEPPKEETT